MTKKPDFQESVFKNFSSEQAIPQYIIRNPPTPRHLRDVQRILKDFGIKKNVYAENFNTVGDLQRWLHSVIVEHLYL